MGSGGKQAEKEAKGERSGEALGYAPPNTFEIWRFQVYWWQEWADVFKRSEMNWIDMNIFRIHFEKAYYKESAEINLGLFGLNVGIEYFWGERDGA